MSTLVSIISTLAHMANSVVNCWSLFLAVLVTSAHYLVSMLGPLVCSNSLVESSVRTSKGPAILKVDESSHQKTPLGPNGVGLKYMIRWLYWEYRAPISAITEAPTADSEKLEHGKRISYAGFPSC